MIADTPTVVVVVVALIAIGAGAAIGLFVRPSVFFALGLGASVLSGNSERLGLPIGLDRVLILGGLGALVLGVTVSPRPPGVRKFRAVEVLMVVLASMAIASALVVGSLTQSQGFYALLDRLGIVPFVAFALADRVFGTEEDRRFLVGVMTVVGAYLAVTAIFEIVGMTALVFPKYINDPLLGTHWGRARGPFLEAGANGLALFECGVAAMVGVAIFRRRAVRLAGIAVAAGCGLGVLLTLTRAGLDRRGRRRDRRLLAASTGATMVAAGGGCRRGRSDGRPSAHPWAGHEGLRPGFRPKAGVGSQEHQRRGRPHR